MNYIYDIVLNFNSNYYEFYEWNKNDNIINIRKIPTFKVDNQKYYDFKFNDITVKNDFLKLIEDETSIYLGNTNKYMCIITNSKEAIGIMFNKNGLIIKKSSLIIDEENEVLELAYDIENTRIDYQVNRVCKKMRLVSRSEGEKKKKIIILIAAAAVVIAGVIIAFFMTGDNRLSAVMMREPGMCSGPHH